ncbi:MAG: site-specific DNA-methyltransferase [Sulfurimonas sp.]|uniref:site-specific DNA-methyltransferase n=1 Tax=Sulfurimonas sp. TaxID=2022749 RepID=UPI0028CCBF88|nr:site-specific DNA-methyltransferase [Sulfurimonas sp.]MDT8337852.1 site-specific DNA-methyltransferase [Sulfurimonas sp.]
MINLESQDINNHKIEELEKVEELKNIFPEAFEDGKLNIEKFKKLLFDIKDEKTEHYSFNWSGKQDCYKIIKQKSNATLKLDDDKTILDGDNVFIEGDNLEVLKLLQTSYHKKIKMIYIDPPYNKDKDFVYSDTWGDTITNYLIQTDQLREEGYTSTKTSSSGRRHTNWLNMIYPRLWLSRNLLKDDGVIFVSIDDDEVHNLRKVMDEIYGEENFVASFLWKKKSTTSNTKGTEVSPQMDYNLCYRKTDKAKIKQRVKEKENREYPYNDSEGNYRITVIEKKDSGSYKRNTMKYPILGYKPRDGKRWQIGEKTAKELELKNRFYYDGEKIIQKIYDFEDEDTFSAQPNILPDVGSTDSAAQFLNDELFGVSELFDNPKPVNLIKHFLNLATNENDIILDFFAGSGTTAHAVMQQNIEDNGNRKYILVQLPETTEENSEAYKAGYKKISDITKARIKKVIEKLDYKDGFKSYKLDSSNFQVFKELKKRPNDSFEDIMKMLKMSVFTENILTQGAKHIDIVYEVALKNGFSLSAKNEEIKTPKYSFIRLYEERREFCFCFDKEIQTDIQEFIPEGAKLICFDKALSDSTKLNLRENIDLETL